MLELNKYYNLYNVKTKEWKLAYYHKRPDTNQYVFGFNYVDGGDYVDEKDLEFTEVHVADIRTDEMPIYGCTINDLLNIVTDQSDEMFGGMTEEMFGLTPSEFNHFANAPLRLHMNARELPLETIKYIILDRFEGWKKLVGKE